MNKIVDMFSTELSVGDYIAVPHNGRESLIIIGIVKEIATHGKTGNELKEPRIYWNKIHRGDFSLSDRYESYTTINKFKTQGIIISNSVPDNIKEKILYNQIK